MQQIEASWTPHIASAEAHRAVPYGEAITCRLDKLERSIVVSLFLSKGTGRVVAALRGSGTAQDAAAELVRAMKPYALENKVRWRFVPAA